MAEKIIPFVTADSFAKTKHISHGLTLAQKRGLIQKLGNRCFILFDHYMYKANAKSTDFSDEKVAKELGYTTRAVQAARLQLIKNKWFYQCNVSHSHIHTIRVIIIGQKTVQEFNKNPEASLSKIMATAIKLENAGFSLEELK